MAYVGRTTSDIDEESIYPYKYTVEDGSIPPLESNRGLLLRIQNYLKPKTTSSLLPLHHQHNSRNQYNPSGKIAMSSETFRNESLESNATSRPDPLLQTGKDVLPPSPDLPAAQVQQHPNNKRRKRSRFGKVKESVARPARAVGRRVFKQRHKVGREEIGNCIADKATDDIFRENSLSEVSTLNGGSNHHRTNSLRQSLRRMLSKGSLSRTGSTVHRNNNLTSIPTYETHERVNDDDWPVRNVESITRKAVVLCGAYLLGVHHPEWSEQVSSSILFILTAWATCLVILGLQWLQKSNYISKGQQHQDQPLFASQQTDYRQQWQWQQRREDPELMPLIKDEDQNATEFYGTSPLDTTESVIHSNNDGKNTARHAEATKLEDDAVVESSSSTDNEQSNSFEKKQQDYKLEHPKLGSFYALDTYTGERINCNSSIPFRISNEWMEVDMLAMIRTPDADDPSAMGGSPANDKVSDHFRKQLRRFEFQFQINFKKVPVGKQLYLSCELEDQIKMGVVTKAFINAAMAFVKSMNPDFHYNITGSKKKTSDGKYETAHMSFLLEAGMDRIVVTKPGSKPPELGTKIYEDPESIKKRKSGKLIDWINTEDTYTMAIWSSYADFLDWRIQNLPGIKPFGLASVIGKQAFNLTVYMIDADREGDNHYRKDITEVIKLELSNECQSGLGKEASKWINSRVLDETRATHSDELPELPSQPIRSCVSNDSLGVDESNRVPTLGAIDMMDEIDEVDRDNADAAELGEGLYLRSGDSVILREFLSEVEKGTAACTVINGGGFAVLSKRNVPIIIEKTKRSKKNKLIKSGDTVMFKMLQTKAGTDEIETRYLTIHRGWWLKWVTTMPSKNGYFTIYTHETELGEKALPTGESRSSFLTLGGTFYLRHKRWSRYSVGISSEPSIDFGGRLLSLYNNKRNKGASIEEDGQQAATYQSDDEDVDNKDMPSISDSGRIKPLVLCAHDPQQLIPMSPRSPTKFKCSADQMMPQTPEGCKLIFSKDHSCADVPAWIEMMDREQRVRQLAYVIRIIHRNSNTQAGGSYHEETFTRLKSGRDLARIMSIGQSMKIPQTYSQTLVPVNFGNQANTPSNTIAKSQSCQSFSSNGIFSVDENDKFTSLQNNSISNRSSVDEDSFPIRRTSSEESGSYEIYAGPSIDTDYDEEASAAKYETDNSLDDESMNSLIDDSASESSFSSDTEAERPKKKRLRKLKKLGRKKIKSTSKIAAKKLIGKKLKPPVSLKTAKQPKKVPKKKNRDSDTEISKKMKKLGKIEAKSGRPPVFVAGELSATEQSRRTASRVLERMSSVPMQSSVWHRCNEALLSGLGFVTDHDSWFLDGDSVTLGVKPGKNHGKLLGESVVARCLWESHWREEWCGMYESSLSFYAPLAKSSCRDIFYSDITKVRPLNVDSVPLPGFPILVIETAWQCHYIAFRDKISRDNFGEKVDRAVKSCKAKEQTETNELQKARFWQGFRTLSESSLAAGAAKWAKISSSQKSRQRAILNGRRMAFDSSTMSFAGSVLEAYNFVEELLTIALSFSVTTLEQDPESFIEFLDLTSELRFLPLEEIDRSSPYAFCMFVNIYHCLLQQALLLSVNGPLHKKSIVHFMRTSCYEIGGDVFSLAELHSCVICGKMSKPINPKPPYVEAPKQSSAHKYYALDYTDARVHFVLNTADMACPASVPVMSHQYIEQQLNAACAEFLSNRQLLVDIKRRTITLPKICEVRRSDFGNGEIVNILKVCWNEIDRVDSNLGNSIRLVLEKGEKGLTIKFQHTQEQYHSSLKLTTTATNQSLEMEYCDGILESNSTEQRS